MNQLHLFDSTEKAPQDRDCFLSGTPDIPDPQETIRYTNYEALYPEIGNTALKGEQE